MKPSEIINIKLLSNYLKIDYDTLLRLINNDYIVKDHTYSDSLDNILVIKQFALSKKRGGDRIVYSANSDTLTNCLKILNNYLKSLYVPIDNVHGFVKGRSIRTNAIKHLSKNIILKLDIKLFFDSIDAEMISNSLQRLGFNVDVSNAISRIATHENKLVQGFHTSPTLANLCFRDIDIKLASIDENISYTRYADDLYFSSNEEFDIKSQVAKILEENRFELNHEKTNIMRRGGKQYVTGLTIFDSHYPRIPKHIKRKLRQQIYYIKKYGYKGHVLHKLNIRQEEYLSDPEKKSKVDSSIDSINRKISGWILYINSIEPDFAEKCRKELYSKS